MVNPFQLIAERLAEYGFYNFFLPWIITTAVFWGLFKKSGILGSDVVNGVLALAVSFFIWGYLISPAAVEITTPLSTFFTQMSIIVLVFLFGIVGASMLYPDFGGALKESIRGGGWLWVSIVIAVLLVFMSGLGGVIFKRPGIGVGGDITTIIYVLAVIVIGIFILSTVTSGGGG